MGGTDLHCHILPGIDDGAKSIEISSQLLEQEAAQGIRQIAFTPHFYSEKISAEDFFKRRNEAFDSIKDTCDEKGIEAILGAEVLMTPKLLEFDLRPFCFTGTDYLLLEWPFITYPLWGNKIIEKLLSSNIKPIFAHIERFEYFYGHPETLREYIKYGVICQTNATSILRPETQKNTLRLIKDGFIHITSSDSHSPDHRPVRLKDAYDTVEKKLGDAALKTLLDNANAIFNGNSVKIEEPKKQSGIRSLFKF